MDIAIIGAGNVGTALARPLARAGHNVTISATHPEHAAQAAKAIVR
jgi:predicted dinucleotide-binding enzyme